MITTCARSGSSSSLLICTCSSRSSSVSTASAPAPPHRSVVALDVPDQLLQVRPPKGGHRPLVVLQAPGPEGEVDVTGRVLDRRPQRPPVLGHEPLEARPGDPVDQRSPVVAGDQQLELVVVEVALAGDVAEFEARVVVARVLVVDEVDPLTVVDEVPGQQIVVARHRRLTPDGQGAPDPRHVTGEVEVVRREPEAPVPHLTQVAGLDVEHVEVVDEPAATVQLTAGRRHALDHPGSTEIVVAERVPLDVTDDEDGPVRQVVDDRRTHAGPVSY